MATSLGTVHAAILGSIAVVEQFGRQASERGALRCLERKRRNGRAVLSKVNDKRFARTDIHLLALGIFAGDDNFAESNVASTFDTLPNVGLDGSQRQVFAQINLSTIRRKDVTGELEILHGG